MTKIGLLIAFIFLSILEYYFHYEIISKGQIISFTLIAVHYLKDLEWEILKLSCKNSKDKICKFLFKKTDEKSNDNINIKEIKKGAEIKEIEAKESV